MTCGNCVHYDNGRCSATLPMWLNSMGDPPHTTGDTDASVCEAWEWGEGEFWYVPISDSERVIADIRALEALLANLPLSSVIERNGLESRLIEQREKLARLDEEKKKGSSLVREKPKE